MESLFWNFVYRTAETEFIFNLFHLLLAGLTFLVLVYQLRTNRKEGLPVPNRLLPLGFFLLLLNFAVFTFSFAAGFLFRGEWQWEVSAPLSHGLLVCGSLIVVAGYLTAVRQKQTLATWITLCCVGVVAALALLDFLRSPPRVGPGQFEPSGIMLASDVLVLVVVAIGLRAVLWDGQEGQYASLVALASMGFVFFLHGGFHFVSGPVNLLIWNAEQHLLSLMLFAFAWAAGEGSRNLLVRIFVRLNLTFIVLAGSILLITAGMEKYQYLRFAEERSMNLAEFLRGHIIYYRGRGEGLQNIFRHPEVLRRVVVEFSTLPELREVYVYFDGQRASFRYTQDWEIQEEIVPLTEASSKEPGPELANSFRMISLPIEGGNGSKARIEFIGTMDYINQYITKYIIMIYSLFTIMVGVASAIIGMIVTDTDRRLRQQYAELQYAHQQLAQAARLASLGELAGGVAHEINTPITSILSLGSHLAEGKDAAALPPSQRKSLQVIAEQAERASKIVRNLLTFARQSHMEMVPVDVRGLLETAITLAQYRLREDAIVLRREMAADLPFILGDTGRLTEVFVNLLNNAIDAMPSGGILGVRAFRIREPDRGVRIEISDTGFGISPEHLPRIFDPFFTTKEPGKGTGLGLSISHGIVKNHGGQIWAESQPGKGTTVVVTLPEEVSKNEGSHIGH